MGDKVMRAGRMRVKGVKPSPPPVPTREVRGGLPLALASALAMLTATFSASH